MDNNQQPTQPSGGAGSRSAGQPIQPNRPTQRYSHTKKPDGTIEVKIIVPAGDVERIRRTVIDELLKEVEVQGFRKGTAPRNLAEQKLNPEQIKQEVLKKTISDEYIASVKALDLRPIINPRVHVEAFVEGTNLEFSAETCEEPRVELRNYKDEVKKIKPMGVPTTNPQSQNAQNTGSLQAGQAASLKSNQNTAPSTPNAQEAQNLKLDQILNVVLNVAQIQIPKILVEQEADRLLSQLLDELKRLGVSLDQYLASRQKTAEQLRGEYETRALQDLKLEFILRKISDEEKITVDQPDIDKALAQIKDPNEREQISKNPYLVGAIIRQQKTLDFLSKI